ncbi:MAG: hypothetical protein K1X94_29690 [Sandaracinaceae bacterium]|nr:hypothetical protein [Sandaracinaceae bacterium]
MIQLRAAGLTLPLVRPPTGVLLDSRAGRLDPLVWLVNGGVTGALPGLRDALRDGGTVHDALLSMYPAGPGFDRERAREVWRELSGQELGDDVILIAFDLADELLAVPRAAALELLDALLDVRTHPEKVVEEPDSDGPE